MALTEAARLRLEGKDVAKVFEGNKPHLTEMAERARKLIGEQFPNGRQPGVDDIKKTLLPLIELDPVWRKFSAKLKEKYWISDFTDYVLERIYTPKLQTPPKEK